MLIKVYPILPLACLSRGITGELSITGKLWAIDTQFSSLRCSRLPTLKINDFPKYSRIQNDYRNTYKYEYLIIMIL